MTAHVFNARRFVVTLSKHFDVEQESPLAFSTKIRGMLQDVRTQNVSGRDSLITQVNCFSTGQSKVGERTQRAHDLWTPRPAHIHQLHAFANETMNCVRLRVRDVESFDLSDRLSEANFLRAGEWRRFDKLSILPEESATARAKFIKHGIEQAGRWRNRAK